MTNNKICNLKYPYELGIGMKGRTKFMNFHTYMMLQRKIGRDCLGGLLTEPLICDVPYNGLVFN
jgi:hypothetical protein